MSNSVDELNEPSHLDLCCLQKPIIIACGSGRVKLKLVSLRLSSLSNGQVFGPVRLKLGKKKKIKK